MLWGLLQPGGDGGLDLDETLAHGGAFFVFTLLTAWNLPRRMRLPGSVAAALVLAVATEWAQSMVPGRAAEALDVVANVIGVAVAGFLVAVVSDAKGS
jgi:VanZ family protein